MVIMYKYDILLFDLGGVLADFAGFRELIRFLPQTVSMEEVHERWLISKAIRRFETGSSSPYEFAVDFLAEWNLSMEPDQFLSLFRLWLLGPYEGALELLTSLKKKYELALLSNCNEIHWSDLEKNQEFMKLFHYRFSSHNIGLVKPDIEIFKYVISMFDVKPEKIAFFDDSQTNIKTAGYLGMGVFKVCGLNQLKDKLLDMKIIDPISER